MAEEEVYVFLMNGTGGETLTHKGSALNLKRLKLHPYTLHHTPYREAQTLDPEPYTPHPKLRT